MPNPPGIWYNVREGKSEHESKTDAHACMRRPGAIHENAPASPGSRRVSGHLPECIKAMSSAKIVTAQIACLQSTFWLARF